MKKIIFGLLGLIVLAVVGGGAYIYMNGTSLIRQAVVDYGPGMTGTTVGLDGVSLMPLTGKAGISGLSIGTPSNYSAPYTFKVDTISVSLQPKTVLDKVLVINDLSIDAPSIVYEPKGKSSNIQEIQKNLENYVASLDSSSSTGGPEKVIIKRLAVIQPQVTVFAGGLIGEQSVTVQDIILTDIGVAENGIPPSDVATAIMDQLKPQIMSALKSQAGKAMLSTALEQAAAKGLPVDDVKDLLGGGGDVEGALKKGIGSLFD